MTVLKKLLVVRCTSSTICSASASTSQRTRSVCITKINDIIQINLPTRCNNFSSLLPMFMNSSTCFGRPHAHHQELNNCNSSLWFYRWSVVVAVLLVVVGPDHNQQHSYRHAPTVKPEAATAVVELLMVGVRTPETCSAVHKCQVINLRNCYV